MRAVVVVMMVGAEEARGASRVGDENESVVWRAREKDARRRRRKGSGPCST